MLSTSDCLGWLCLAAWLAVAGSGLSALWLHVSPALWLSCSLALWLTCSLVLFLSSSVFLCLSLEKKNSSFFFGGKLSPERKKVELRTNGLKKPRKKKKNLRSKGGSQSSKGAVRRPTKKKKEREREKEKKADLSLSSRLGDISFTKSFYSPQNARRARKNTR